MTVVRRIALLITVAILVGGAASAPGHGASTDPAAHHSLREPLTDRDIVVRVIADGKDPSSVTVGDVASRDVATLTVDQNVEDAIRRRATACARR